MTARVCCAFSSPKSCPCLCSSGETALFENQLRNLGLDHLGIVMDWSDIKYFKEEEFRPPGCKSGFTMGMGFLLKLDLLRSQVGCPITVHKNGGFAVSGHSKKSLHYLGLAADVNIGDATGAPMDVVHQALLVYKWTFLSIGIYNCWGTQGVPGHLPGLHLDDRTAIGVPKKVWFLDHAQIAHVYPYEDFHRCIQDLIVCREKWRSRRGLAVSATRGE